MARRANRRPPQTSPAREATLVVRSVGAKGDGVAASPSGDVYLPFTLPGERVRAAVEGDRGRLIEIVEASGERVSPPCAHFGRCGGCALQHWRRDAYLDWKHGLVVDALARVGLGETPVDAVVETPTAVRRRATVAAKRQGDRWTFGFKARGTHDIEPIDQCLVLHPRLLAVTAKLSTLAAFFPAGWSAAALALTLCDNGVDLDIAPMSKGGALEGGALARFGEAMASCGVIRASRHGDVLLQHAAPVVAFAGVAVTPPPGGFLQASREGEAALVSLVETAAAGARRAVDLFAGCGSFSFPLARAATVVAYDSSAEAVEALVRAARHAVLKPVTAARRDLFVRPLTAAEFSGADVVVFDPPRAGAAAQAAEIARSTAPTVVAVSCNVATYARDAATLAAGGYRLERTTPVDQFAFSGHVELVGVFRRDR